MGPYTGGGGGAMVPVLRKPRRGPGALHVAHGAGGGHVAGVLPPPPGSPTNPIRPVAAGGYGGDWARKRFFNGAGITQNYNPTFGNGRAFEAGVDLGYGAGMPIKLAVPGTYQAALSTKYQAVFRDKFGGLFDSYTHVDVGNFRDGQSVAAGTVIGTVDPRAGVYDARNGQGYDITYHSGGPHIEYGRYRSGPGAAYYRGGETVEPLTSLGRGEGFAPQTPAGSHAAMATAHGGNGPGPAVDPSHWFGSGGAIDPSHWLGQGGAIDPSHVISGNLGAGKLLDPKSWISGNKSMVMFLLIGLVAVVVLIRVARG